LLCFVHRDRKFGVFVHFSCAASVVIVTDAKLEIVFASHNMTKMNGYVEEK
jgi:hypothetical protein